MIACSVRLFFARLREAPGSGLNPLPGAFIYPQEGARACTDPSQLPYVLYKTRKEEFRERRLREKKKAAPMCLGPLTVKEVRP